MRSSPLQHIQYGAQRCGFDVAADPDAVTMRQLDLDEVGRQQLC